MNIALDPCEWRFASPDDAAASHGAHPDWHVLRARLRVELEARAALDARSGEAPSRLPGSFSHSASLSLERISGSYDRVNQTSSVNRKRDGCIVSEVADQSTTGERG
jgi:hypothetical protein